MGKLMLHKAVWSLPVLAIFSILTACQDKEIVGRWESIENKGGLANILEIQPDGKIKSLLVARIDRRYRIEGKQIILTDLNDTGASSAPAKQPAAAEKPAAKGKKLAKSGKKAGAKQENAKPDDKFKLYGQGGEPVNYEFAFENDKLKLTHEESKTVMDMRREGPASVPGSIVGHWTYKHTTGQTAHMIFEPNGILRFNMLLPGGVESTYKLKDGTISLFNADMKVTQSASYKMEEGKLVLNDGKSIFHYTRLADPQ